MAKYSSKDVAFCLLDGYSILGTRTDVSWKKSAETEETTGLGVADVEHAATGLKRAELTQNGFYDDAAGSANAALVGSVGAARVLCIGVEGNAKGRRFTGFAGAMQSDYERVASRGALHRANASHLGSGKVEEGIILHELAAETTDPGNTDAASVDNAASSANGGTGYAQVSALTLGGFSNVGLSVRHSADNVTFAALINFANVSAAPAAERKTVTGTVNRYLSAGWDFGGVGSGQSVTFMVGFHRA